MLVASSEKPRDSGRGDMLNDYLNMWLKECRGLFNRGLADNSWGC
jgi:hypothetical protein